VCVDLSATPYYLGRMGPDTNRIFPWVVKVAAARSWVAAVNADRRYGSWAYAIVKRVADVEGALTHAAQ
ncbi:MAG: hypothetical protein ACRDGB_09050, partial [Candidatus Limnocylindria bacterium]